MIIIDASNLIVGRLATYAAKQALLGEEVKIVNSENAYISGKKQNIFDDFQNKRDRGTPMTGPYIHRRPDMILRRTIRGMLPFKKPRGKEAFKRVMCYVGIPEELKDKKAITLEYANISKLPTLKYVDLKTLSKRLGAKVE
ncbi:50S ribosomal protein L13 [Candidatus Woesearchaeota archaeon]|nr:50S ribosomal protein L13 [Candidatus Woesearchaeota archaeon]